MCREEGSAAETTSTPASGNAMNGSNGGIASSSPSATTSNKSSGTCNKNTADVETDDGSIAITTSTSSSNSSTATQAASVQVSQQQQLKDSYVLGRAQDGAMILGSLRPKQQFATTAKTSALASAQQQQQQQDAPVCYKVGIHGTWYDVTKFAAHHPGGDIILDFDGRDATAQFLAYHDPSVLEKGRRQLLPKLGTYDFDAKKPGGSDFQGAWMALNAKFEREGRYITPVVPFLAARVAILFAFLSGVVTMIPLYLRTGNYLAFMFGAACLAAIWQQSGFLMHDTMHNHVFHNRRKDGQLGYLFGNILVGISGKWWRDEHNEHHVFTNALVTGVGPADPQMIEDVWIQDAKLEPYFAPWTVRFILEYQQYYFVPILVIVGLLFVKIDAITHTRAVRCLPDVIGLSLHILWVGAILSFLPSALERVVFYFLANCLSGCLGVQLLVSHFAKPWVEKDDTKRADSWAARQVEAVTDITCHPCLDWFHGGLHIHSVHHLFPRMCRWHYRAVYNEIIDMCDDHGVALERYSCFEAIGRCLKHFASIKGKVAANSSTGSTVAASSSSDNKAKAE